MAMSTAQLNMLVNAYRGAINQAERLHDRYRQDPSIQLLADESLQYKTAADICGLLANEHSTSELVRGDWLAKQRRAEEKIREIKRLADNEPEPVRDPVFADVPPEKAAPASSRSSSRSSGASRSSGSSGQSSSGGKKRSADELSDEDVQKWFRDTPPEHGFDQVAGMTSLVEQLRSCLPDPAADAVKDHMGVSRINGIFLYGPPGCGKTYCINAFIHELMVNYADEDGNHYKYMFLSGSDIHDKYVGGAERRVKRAFEEAANNAPCILFIDEIENVCRNRSTPNLPGHAWSTTAQFLTSFYDLLDSKKKVIFIGATNYPNMVEGAMLDRIRLVQVPLPDSVARKRRFEILGIKESGIPRDQEPEDTRSIEPKLYLEEGFHIMDMAQATINYSYRDFNRLIEALTTAMNNEMKDIYGADGAARVEAMKTGTYPLRRELFEKIIASHKPSKKDEMIRSLDAWDSEIQSTLEG